MTAAVAPEVREAPAEPVTPPPQPPHDRGWAARLEGVALAAVVVGIGLATLLPHWGQFTPDTKPDIYFVPGRVLADALSAWTPGSTGLGQTNFNVGVAPMAAVLWPLRAAGISAWLTVRLWRWALLVVALFGFRRYAIAVFRGRLGHAGRTAAGVFAVVNPYVIVAGSTTPVLLPYALLPWMLVAVERAVDEPRRWRYPALTALAFFAMTGMNAGIVPLMCVVAVPCHLLARRLTERTPWRDLGRVAARTAVLGAGVSVYWALPAFLANGTGSGIASATEHPADIAQTTSWAESGRLLGLWPLYGRDSSGLFQGVFVSYVDAPFVLISSYAVPVLVALGAAAARLRRVRVLVALLIVVSLPVMVGMYPPANPTLWGKAVRAAFDHISATLAFRTTNKIGAVLVLAYALALAAGADSLARWVRRPRAPTVATRWAAAGAAVILVGGAATPLLTGSVYEFHWSVPQYWDAAGSTMTALGPGSRTLLLPGQTGGHYTWGVDSPDDIVSFLTTHPTAVRSTVGARGDPTANLLTNVDSLLQRGSLPASTLSALARYLGAGTVLLRNDVADAKFAGAPPDVVAAQVDADPGLTLTQLFGRGGAASSPATTGATGTAAALALYDVARPGSVVATRPAGQTVLVDGDGAALPTLANLGLVDGNQPFRFLAQMTEQQLLQAVKDGARIELTDTNRRRSYSLNRLAQPFSATLGARDPLDESDAPTLTLDPDDPDAQTVAVLSGAKSITASPDSFGLKPYGSPELAFDANFLTGWLTGEFGTGAGKWIDISFDAPRRIDHLTLVPVVLGAASITRVRVQAGATTVEAALSPVDPTTVTFPSTTAASVRVTILDTTPGANPVGFTEVETGVSPQLSARLPRQFADLAAELPPSARATLARLPLDVVFTRLSDAEVSLQSEEPDIARTFDLPQPRSVSFTGEIDEPGSLPTAAAADLAGATPGRTTGTCFDVAELDGKAISARLESTSASAAAGEPVKLTGCGPPIELAAGDHQFRSAAGWQLDVVRLASPGAPRAPVPSPPSVAVTHRGATSLTAHLAPSAAPYWLTIGQSWDPRWRATLDGHPLGAPEIIDGFDTGWRIDGGAHVLKVSFGPQKTLDRTLAVSALALAVVVALALWPAREPTPVPPPDGSAPAAPGAGSGDDARDRGSSRRAEEHR